MPAPVPAAERSAAKPPRCLRKNCSDDSTSSHNVTQVDDDEARPWMEG
jgi:hypothetical protein